MYVVERVGVAVKTKRNVNRAIPPPAVDLSRLRRSSKRFTLPRAHALG